MIGKFICFILLASVITFAQTAPKLVINEMTYDFGTVKEGSKVQHNFKIKNQGKDPLVIRGVRASCGCTAAKPEKNELKPGESTDLNVTFNSSGRLGQQHKIIYIESNDPDNPTMQLSLTGTVAEQVKPEDTSPNISFTETSHDFGKVNEGQVPEYTFKFKNSGKSTLEIKDVKTSCGCTAALVSSKKIEPGKEGTLRVELDTKNRSGKMTRMVTVTTNDPDEPQRVITITAEIIKKG